MAEKIRKSDQEWRAELDSETYRITRRKGTEPAFTGAYYDTKEPGTYYCVCCGEPLFDSEHKYSSGTGWPSFYRPAEGNRVEEHTDFSHGMVRTEVICSR